MRTTNPLIGIMAALFLTACDRGVPAHSRPQALARWQETLISKEHRGPAQTTGATTTDPCWRDAATTERLRLEIQQLESAATGAPLRLRWPTSGGIDLSLLPWSQASLLALQGARFSPHLISYSSCADAICVFNRAHGQSDQHITGLYAYWIYLKTGMILAAEKNPFTFASMSRWNAPETCRTEISARQFSTAEVRRLAEIIRALPDGWVAEAAPHAVFRYRRGYRPAVNEAACRTRPEGQRAACLQCLSRLSEAERACGVPADQPCATAISAETTFGSSGRFTIFTDSALGTEGIPISLQDISYHAAVPRTTPRNLNGEAWFTVTHEFTHLFDSPGLDFYQLSRHEDWMRLTGFDWITETRGGSSRWVPQPRSESRPATVNAYAATHPAEDLAVTSSFVRFDPENTEHTVPEKSAFISTHVYGGRTYTPTGLGTEYRRQIASDLAATLPQWLETCRTRTGSRRSSTVLGVELLNNFPPAFRSCVSAEFDTAYARAVRDLKIREMEACDYVPTRANALREAAIADLRPRLEELLIQEDAGRAVLEAETRLTQALATQIDPRETLQACWNSVDAPRTECFTTLLTTAFDAAAAPFRTAVGSRLSALRTRYLAEHSYSSTLETTRLGYQAMLAGVEPEVQRLAEERWTRCEAAGTRGDLPTTPTLTPFDGGETYMDPRLLDCLNRGAVEELHAARDQLTGATHSLTSPSAVQFVDDIILFPAFRETLRAHVVTGLASETGALETLGARARLSITAGLTSNLQWLSGAFAENAGRTLCLSRVLTDPAFTGTDLTRQLDSLRFISRDEWRGGLASEICDSLLASPSVVARIRSARDAFQVAVLDLERRLLEASEQTRADCARQIPSTAGSPAGVASARASCFENLWPAATQTAFTEWDRQRTGGAHYYTSELEIARRALWSHLAERIRARAVTGR